MLKAILFDVDGTLVDSNEFHALAWAEAFHAAGHDFRLKDLHDQVGQGSDNYVRALLPDATDGKVRELSEAHGTIYRRHYAHRLKPFPGARALLERCHRAGLRVVLASSGSKVEVDRALDVIGARPVVDGWTSADDVAHSKPCPDIFTAALRKAQVSADEALVVGDTPFDLRAAEAAGVKAVAVRSGLFSDETLTGAVAIYDNVAAILADFEGSPLNPARESAGTH